MITTIQDSRRKAGLVACTCISITQEPEATGLWLQGQQEDAEFKATQATQQNPVFQKSKQK